MQDYANSIGEPPEWSEDGRTVAITVKPWKWSNGETLCAAAAGRITLLQAGGEVDPGAAHFQRSLSLTQAFADDNAFSQRAGLRFGSE